MSCSPSGLRRRADLVRQAPVHQPHVVGRGRCRLIGRLVMMMMMMMGTVHVKQSYLLKDNNVSINILATEPV